MRLVQIPVVDRPECLTALQFAFALAGRLGADVRGFHLRTHRSDSSTVKLRKGGQFGWTGEIAWSKSEQESEKLSRSAKGLFEDLAGHAGLELRKKPAPDGSPVAVWQDRVGTPDYVMPVVGPTADLMVVSRPSKKGGKKATAFLMQALLNSHRPVLIVPDKKPGKVGSHILVAWNNSPDAARLVHSILPVLKAADKVTFVTVGKVDGSGPNVNEMCGFLSHHGINAEKHAVKGGDTEVEIEKAMKQVGADTIAIGAYSRNRFSERLFGGVTQHMLFKSNKPVLTLHS